MFTCTPPFFVFRVLVLLAFTHTHTQTHFRVAGLEHPEVQGPDLEAVLHTLPVQARNQAPERAQRRAVRFFRGRGRGTVHRVRFCFWRRTGYAYAMSD